MKKTAFISDIIFTFFAAALVSLCVFRYLGMRLWLSLLLCVLCGVLAAFLVGSILHLRQKTTFLKKSDEAQKQKLLLHLALMSNREKTQFLRTAIAETPLQKSSALRLFDDERFYFLNFKLSPVTADEIPAYARWKTDKQKILLCAEIDESAQNLCARLNVEVRTGEQVYALVKAQNALPKQYLGDEVPELKRKNKLRLGFSKANAKRFLTSAALVVAASFLTPFTFYYLLFGGILLLTAILVRIFGYN